MLKIKLLDFNVYDNKTYSSDNDSDNPSYNEIFTIQIFGIDEERNTYSIMIDDFKPYFYCKCPNNWKKNDKNDFVGFLNKGKNNINHRIVKSDLVEYKKFHNEFFDQFGVKGFHDAKLELDKKYFYNNPYHLTKKGVKEKTLEFKKQLQALLLFENK